MIHNMWKAWGWMTGGLMLNAVAGLVYPPACWVTVPLALLLVIHYLKVTRP